MDDDETPFGIMAARVTRERNGRLYAVNCLLQYSKPMQVDAAIERVRGGKIAFVRRSQAQDVLNALKVVEVG